MNEHFANVFFNLTFGTMLLAIALLLWAVFELRYQRDTYRTLWCIEVLKTDPEHPVCEEQ